MNKKIIKAVPAYNKLNKFVLFILVRYLNIKVVKNYITLIDSIIKNFNVYIFEDKITNIPANCFRRCELLKEVIIPEGVTILLQYSFICCYSLTHVVIPDSVKAINSYAFAFCKSLENITMPKFINSINYYAFDGCDKLKPFDIPNSVKFIDICSFPFHLRKLYIRYRQILKMKI